MVYKVCIYGTLRKGRRNHKFLIDPSNGSSTFVCNAVTKFKFPLILDSTQSIPYLLDAKGEGKRVECEIYNVDDKMKSFLDDFEALGILYDIGDIEVESDTGENIKALVYFLRNFKEELPNRPCYDSYTIQMSEKGVAIADEKTFEMKLDEIVKEVKRD